MSNERRHEREADRLTRWVQEHGRALYGFVYAQTGDRHAADDIVQDTFCRAWTARARYQESGRERGYLVRIADRLVSDRRRRRRVQPDSQCDPLSLEEPATAVEGAFDELARREHAAMLTSALNQLSEPQKRALLLRYFGNLTFQEIADILACPLNTALSHVHRGLAAMRKLLVEKL